PFSASRSACTGGRQVAHEPWRRARARRRRSFPPTSERYRQVHTTLNYFETVGTLHKHGLINEQLLFDWLAVEAVWDRVKSLAIGDREQYGIPALWENFEAMA
ncbi:MAG TPA: hypothetical protein VFD39_05415, partial [Trueperaceae bacterium]|nr:hypothetical protein [Trueperaceae bacterium]